MRIAALSCSLAVALTGCIAHAERSDTRAEARATSASGTLTRSCRATAESCIQQVNGYAVQARAGQTLTVTLSPQDGRVIISDILDPHRKSIIPPDTDEDYWFGGTVKVNEAGEYSVMVSTTETATETNRYTVSMTVR